MKKKYIIPTVEVIGIETGQTLLAGSGGISFSDSGSGKGSLNDEYADEAW